MNPDDILALTPGPQLDAAVHTHIFNRKGKPAAYSTRSTDAITLIDRLPLFVARVDPAHPRFDAARPFIAGTLAHEPSVKGDVTLLRVSAATLSVALTKAALLYTFREVKAPRPARTTAADQARDIVARIGTPAARHPNNARVQPTARVHHRDQRAPMPKRPERFVGPDIKQPS